MHSVCLCPAAAHTPLRGGDGGSGGGATPQRIRPQELATATVVSACCCPSNAGLPGFLLAAPTSRRSTRSAAISAAPVTVEARWGRGAQWCWDCCGAVPGVKLAELARAARRGKRKECGKGCRFQLWGCAHSASVFVCARGQSVCSLECSQRTLWRPRTSCMVVAQASDDGVRKTPTQR